MLSTLAQAGSTPTAAAEPYGGIKLAVGIVFAAVVLGFLMYIVLKKPTLTDDQRKIIRFLCAFMAACSGVFISGEALVGIHKDDPTTKLVVEGTAGFALFILVWLTYEPLRRKAGANAFAITFVEDMSFARAAEILADETNHKLNLGQLAPEEQNAPIKGVNVQSPSARDVLARLHRYTKTPDAVRPFTVVEKGSELVLNPS